MPTGSRTSAATPSTVCAVVLELLRRPPRAPPPRRRRAPRPCRAPRTPARTRGRCRARPPVTTATCCMRLPSYRPCHFRRRSTTRSRRSSATACRRPTRSSTCTAATSRRCRPAGPTPSRSRSPPPRCRPCSRRCHAHGVPVVPFAGGSSLEGQVLPDPRRRVARHQPDGADPRDRRPRARRSRPGRRHEGRPERGAARARRVLRGRPGRRRHDRRHGGQRRLGDDDRPLRDDPRERAGARGGARRRHGHPHRLAGAQVQRRLRPDAPVPAAPRARSA